MWQNLKLEEPNIAIKMISDPSVAIVIETHFGVHFIVIELDN
jgi:hypothetical protein